jgi:dUTP pyrophosphatase
VHQPTLQIKRLSPRAALPQYQTNGAAGLDLAACLSTDHAVIEVHPGAIVRVPTGLAIAVPPGYEAQVRARSGLSTKHGLTTINGVGTIDSDYRGELQVALINLGREPFSISHAMRIAQLIIAPVARVEVCEVQELDTTERGSGGFGSTGAH